ncbi:Uncharacterized protein Rs2_15230 [Raphanus sativus]|nr:Uncharacterized protein Rs2_15230 [Raphanus sativus]
MFLVYIARVDVAGNGKCKEVWKNETLIYKLICERLMKENNPYVRIENPSSSVAGFVDLDSIGFLDYEEASSVKLRKLLLVGQRFRQQCLTQLQAKVEEAGEQRYSLSLKQKEIMDEMLSVLSKVFLLP